MNVHAPAPEAAESPLFAEAIRAVNAWRGRCMASFAAVEAQVTNTLVALAAADQSVTLPHLVGQRCVALSLALSRAGETATDAAGALASWQSHDPLRAFLCHGVAKVTVARDGTWQAVFELAALRSKKLQRSFLIIDEAEADLIGRTLHRDRQRLEARLRHLGAVSEPGPAGLRIGTVL
jgi:hypothetical protein